jgi:mono/diheme cytochrome c family protein
MKADVFLIFSNPNSNNMIRNLLLTAGWCLTMVTFSFGQDAKLQESIGRGQEIYGANCISCHQENGEGIEGAFPTLIKTEFVTGEIARLVKIIAQGQSGEIKVNGTVYNMEMPSQGHLSDQEIADVANYIRNSWGNTSKKAVEVADVAKVR